jgi:menaquinone-dependent protoporphyrinogen oxidase
MAIKVLVAYVSNAGSTVEVAQFIGQELGRDGAQVDVRTIRQIEDIGAYQAVLVGGPMIMGWHREAVNFVRRHQLALSRVPVAYFLMAMSLTKTPEMALDATQVYVDPTLAKAPGDDSKLSLRENYATISSYLKPVLTKAPQVRPVSVGFFAGKLDYMRLGLFQRLFVMFVIAAQAGDRRNWDAIRGWAAGLRPQLVDA